MFPLLECAFRHCPPFVRSINSCRYTWEAARIETSDAGILAFKPSLKESLHLKQSPAAPHNAEQLLDSDHGEPLGFVS